MPAKLDFEAWLATLSLDAAHTDLCPNLAYIPLPQLRRLYREGCAPAAEAIALHQWKPRPSRARLHNVSTERLLEEAARRGLKVVRGTETRAHRIGREMAGTGHTDAARSDLARSDQDQEMDRRAVDEGGDREGKKDRGRKSNGGDDSPDNEG
jgi:hypothetical protein